MRKTCSANAANSRGRMRDYAIRVPPTVLGVPPLDLPNKTGPATTTRPTKRHAPRSDQKFYRPFLQQNIGTLRALVNDPSAGSPTETLLRLLLPLNSLVWASFQIASPDGKSPHAAPRRAKRRQVTEAQ